MIDSHTLKFFEAIVAALETAGLSNPSIAVDAKEARAALTALNAPLMFGKGGAV